MLGGRWECRPLGTKKNIKTLKIIEKDEFLCLSESFYLLTYLFYFDLFYFIY